MALSNYFDKFAPYIINKEITNKTSHNEPEND